MIPAPPSIAAPLRVVFMGTPDFADACLERLLASRHEVVAVVSQPDRPAGRGKRMNRPPVAERAERLGLPLLQTDTAKTRAFRDWVASHRPDVAVVVAFGHILGPKALAVPRLGCLNVHASVLPRWRGASPIQAAVLAGDAISGVTVMQMDPGMDTGPMRRVVELTLAPDETAASLHDRLAALGGPAAVAVLDELAGGTATLTPQEDARATMAAKLRKSDGALDVTEPAAALERRIRGLYPWPGTTVAVSGERVKVHPPAHVLPAPAGAPAPGTVVAAGPDGVDVATGDGVLRLTRLQRPGKRALDARDFLAGVSLTPGDRVG